MFQPTKTRQFGVESLTQTQQLAADLAHRLRGGEVIVLDGDLGVGKTAFVRGLVTSLGGSEVSSPSFTIENIYPGPVWPIHHYDFYRLTEVGLDGLTLTEVIKAQTGVVIIEWADLVRQLLPLKRLELTFGFEAQPTARNLVYQTSESLAYLLPDQDLLLE